MAEECSWDVCTNDVGDGVVMSFDEVGPDGVSQFVTAMPPVVAINFAIAIISHATCLFTRDD